MSARNETARWSRSLAVPWETQQGSDADFPFPLRVLSAIYRSLSRTKGVNCSMDAPCAVKLLCPNPQARLYCRSNKVHNLAIHSILPLVRQLILTLSCHSAGQDLLLILFGCGPRLLDHCLRLHISRGDRQLEVRNLVEKGHLAPGIHQSLFV